MYDHVLPYELALSGHDAHSIHSPWRPDSDTNYLPYVGNGYVGIASDTSEQASSSQDDLVGRLHIYGGQRHLSLPVPFAPLVRLESASASMDKGESATVVHYTHGMVYDVKCGDFSGAADGQKVSVTSQLYAHRSVEVNVFNVSGLWILKRFWQGHPVNLGTGHQGYQSDSGGRAPQG